MRLDEHGIWVYSDLKKNGKIKSTWKHFVKFTFDSGAIVEFYSPDPESECTVEMLEKYSGELHYLTKIKRGMFAKSTRESISPLLIKATDEKGRVLLDIDLENWSL